MILPFLSDTIPGGRRYRPLLSRGRQFPGSAGEWAAAFPSVIVADNIWTFQEASGDIDDKIASVDLQAFNAMVYQVTGEPTGRYAVRLNSTNSRFEMTPGGAANYDISTAAANKVFTIWLRYRMPSPPAASRYIMKKRGTRGYWLYFNSDGSLNTTADDSTTSRTATIAGNHCDGAWRDLMFIVNRHNADEMIIRSELGTGTNTLPANTLTETDITNFPGGDGSISANGLEIAYGAGWYGTDDSLKKRSAADFDVLRAA